MKKITSSAKNCKRETMCLRMYYYFLLILTSVFLFFSAVAFGEGDILPTDDEDRTVSTAEGPVGPQVDIQEPEANPNNPSSDEHDIFAVGPTEEEKIEDSILSTNINPNNDTNINKSEIVNQELGAGGDL